MSQTRTLGRDITGATMPAGGSGVRGWLSAIAARLAGVLDIAEERVDTRYEWQLVAATSVPLYLGTALPGSATSAAVWNVQKFTYITGPASDAVPSLIESATGAWDDRATLF